MGMHRRALLLGSAAGALSAPAWAQRTCFDTFDRCFGNVLPGSSAPSLDLNFLAGAPSGLVYTGGGGTFFNVAGAITAATTNVPRFDFDPVTHAAIGMLVEEARTNLLLNSATLSTQSVTTTAVATTLSFYGTGTVTLSGTFAGTLVGSGAFPARNSLTFTPTAGTLTATVTGSVLNAQIEAGAFQTSWISTAGAAATRTADAASIAVGAWFNAAAGTLADEITLPQSALTTNQDLPSLMGPNANDILYLRQGSGSNAVSGLVFSGNANKGSNAPVGSITVGVPFKAAMSYNAATLGIALALNGAANGSFTATLMPATITQIVFGIVRAGNLNGYVRRVRYWPRTLAAAELQQVTT